MSMAWMVLAGVAVLPGAAFAQVVVAVADSHVPKPAEARAVGEPVVANGLLPQAAGAGPSADDAPQSQRALGLNDVQLVYAPSPTQYQPEGHIDMADRGGRVQVACMVGADGHMQDCAVASSALRDPGFAETALGDVQQFIIGPTTANGKPSAGQVFTVTCRFDPVDEGQSLAVLDMGTRP